MGVLMNTRGIVQLVVLNIGVELGVISPLIFAIFVLMAIILTFLTSPILSIVYRKNYDVRKLSVPNIAADLRSIRDSEPRIDEMDDDDNNDNINSQSMSTSDMRFNESKRNSIKTSRESSTNMPIRESVVSFSDRISYADFYPSLNEHETSTGNITGSRLNTPRRSINMTRF